MNNRFLFRVVAGSSSLVAILACATITSLSTPVPAQMPAAPTVQVITATQTPAIPAWPVLKQGDWDQPEEVYMLLQCSFLY